MREFFKILTMIPLVVLAPSSLYGQESNLIKGTWLTKDGESHVKIETCEEGLCNEITWLKSPNDRYGKPLMDKLNKNPK